MQLLFLCCFKWLQIRVVRRSSLLGVIPWQRKKPITGTETEIRRGSPPRVPKMEVVTQLFPRVTVVVAGNAHRKHIPTPRATEPPSVKQEDASNHHLRMVVFHCDTINLYETNYRNYFMCWTWD